MSERDRAGTVKGRGKESGLQGRGVRELAALAEGERVRFQEEKEGQCFGGGEGQDTNSGSKDETDLQGCVRESQSFRRESVLQGRVEGFSTLRRGRERES